VFADEEFIFCPTRARPRGARNEYRPRQRASGQTARMVRHNQVPDCPVPSHWMKAIFGGPLDATLFKGHLTNGLPMEAQAGCSASEAVGTATGARKQQFGDVQTRSVTRWRPGLHWSRRESTPGCPAAVREIFRPGALQLAPSVHAYERIGRQRFPSVLACWLVGVRSSAFMKLYRVRSAQSATLCMPRDSTRHWKTVVPSA
jgi:hypothetical protein